MTIKDFTIEECTCTEVKGKTGKNPVVMIFGLRGIPKNILFPTSAF